MTKKLRGTTTRSAWAVLALVALTCSLAFAGPLPGKWKFDDGGKAVRKAPKGAEFAIVTNLGADRVIVSSKGSSSTNSGTLSPGETGSIQLPRKAKNVKIMDANTGNSLGSKGVLIWAKKLPNIPPIGTGGGGDIPDTGPAGI